MGRWDFSRNDECIICGRSNGEYITDDGPVCVNCMPEEYIPRLPHVLRAQIVAWIRNNGAPEAKLSGKTDAVSEDRSMGITQFDDVILADELNARMNESESLDMVVSFIKCAGLNLIIDSLRKLASRGRVRIITTAYMGATESDAVLELAALPNTEVRMELNVDGTRLHSKGFIFGLKDGGSTVYVGSANISKTALTSGEEWVVKVRGQDLPLVVEDFRKAFDGLWNMPELKKITRNSRAEVESALNRMGRQ